MQVASGAAAVSGGRSWQLVDCAPVDPSAPGGAAALKALKQHLSDVLEVMLPAFGELSALGGSHGAGLGNTPMCCRQNTPGRDTL